MKILIVNTYDISGGAARAAYRLHCSLLAHNIDSQMLVQRKIGDDYTVLADTKILRKVIINTFRPILDRIPIKFYKERSKTLFSVSWLPFSNIVEQINQINPDVVHLHWINDGMLRIEDIAKINAPIIWSLHDMWSFTGGCHYDEFCSKYEKKCGGCPVLGSKKHNDLSRRIFNRKQKVYSEISNITIVALSSWLKECSENSSLFQGKKIVNLPNPIDSNVFRSFDKSKARELWGVPQHKKLILFGAMKASSDLRKGFNELSKAFKCIDRDDIEFVVFGASRPLNLPDLGCKTNYIGCLSDDVSLLTLYSAVDVMVVPSLQENLSNAIMESLACATPVVAFDIGGNSDLIEHKKNGYLAKSLDSTDLAKGIEWVIDNEKYNDLCVNAREKVLKEFDYNVVAPKYINLYENIINE